MSLADEIATRDLWNPYDFANPVDDPTLFAGRTPELKDIRYYLVRAARAPRPINLVLTGPRSAGKTSLLNWIEHEAIQSRFCVARIELNEGDTDPFPLFYKLYDAIIFSAVMDGAFAGVSGKVFEQYRNTIDGADSTAAGCELLFPQHYTTASANGRPLSEPTLKRDLATISKEIGKPMVVLFDECDVLSSSRIELEMLRNVFMNTSGYMLVLAGTPNLFPVMEDVFSPIIRQFKKIPVERFDTRRDTTDCITLPLKQLGIDPNEVLKPTPARLAFEVHRLAGGRPYEIQLLCHFMFKRVEDGNARNMTISLDVLDDVRMELEKQESGTGRRSLSALPKLGRDEISLLQALTEFRGTVEELSLRSQLFGDAPYEVEVLRQALSRFVSLGLLETDESGVVSFVGDQFDEVYARYFAAADGKRLVVSKSTFWQDLRDSFYNLIEENEGLSPIYTFDPPTLDIKPRVQEALSALIGYGDEPIRALPDIATNLYSPLLDAHDGGSAVVAAVRFAAFGTAVTHWLIITDGQSDAFLARPELVDLSARAEPLDFEIDVEIFQYDLGPRAEFIERVRSLSSPNQLREFGERHYFKGLRRFDSGQFQDALREFEQAVDFHPSARHANAVAHIALLTDDYEKAVEFGGNSREIALEAYPEVPLDEYLIGVYDTAVAWIALGRPDIAGILLSECEDGVAATGEEGPQAWLAVPSRTEDGSKIQIEMTSQDPIPLSAATGMVREFLAGV